MRSRLFEMEWLSIYAANRSAVTGLVLVVTLSVLAVAAPLLTPFDPLRGAGRSMLSPGLEHLLGTDNLGRDMAAQTLYGLRVSLMVGLLSTLISVGIGIVIGAAAGYAGGRTDEHLMRFTEVFQVVPRFFLAILLVAIFGQTLVVTTFSIAVLSWPALARVVRAEFLSKRESDYVLAARVVGAGPVHLAFREILPNAMAAVVVTASLNIGLAILLESGLAFIGLSDPNQVSLGRTLLVAVPLIQVAWWLSFFPGLVLSLLILGLNLIGEGITDVMNPRSRSR